MSSTLKMPTIEIFMTTEDEREFSRQLLQYLPEMVFIDLDFWTSPKPVVHSSIADCSSQFGHVSLLNKKITSLEYYCAHHIIKSAHGHYEGHSLGCGLIQYLRSRETDFTPLGLRNGRLSASYHIDKDSDMDTYVKMVFKILKKGAQKLYLIDPETGKVSEKPESRFIAWPDAIKKYDIVNDKYLCANTLVYFTSDPGAKIPEYFINELKERLLSRSV
jgi:hypothetical protein